MYVNNDANKLASQIQEVYETKFND
ncbi:DUF1871 family protein [Candidatus Hamiltonella endosymbiont of Tuberolachnus salignus]